MALLQFYTIRPSPGRFCICIPFEESTEKNLVSQKEKVSSGRRRSLRASAKVVGSRATAASPCSPSAGSAEPARRRMSTSAKAAHRPRVDLARVSSPSGAEARAEERERGGRRLQRTEREEVAARFARPDSPPQLACHRGPPPSRPELARAQVACHLGRTSALMLRCAVVAPALAPDFLSAVAVGDRGRRRICWR
jgi:hypothetical protein